MINNIGVNNTFLCKSADTFFAADSLLSVPEFQEAVLCRNGICLDIFEEGEFKLDESKIPCDIYFVNKGYVANVIWGCGVPIILTFNKEGLEYSLSINGEIGLRIKDTKSFMENILRNFGEANPYEQDKFIRDIRSMIITTIRGYLPTVIDEMNIPSYEVTNQINYFIPKVRSIIAAQVRRLGLEVVGFSVNRFLMTNNVSKNNMAAQVKAKVQPKVKSMPNPGIISPGMPIGQPMVNPGQPMISPGQPMINPGQPMIETGFPIGDPMRMPSLGKPTTEGSDNSQNFWKRPTSLS